MAVSRLPWKGHPRLSSGREKALHPPAQLSAQPGDGPPVRPVACASPRYCRLSAFEQSPCPTGPPAEDRSWPRRARLPLRLLGRSCIRIPPLSQGKHEFLVGSSLLLRVTGQGRKCFSTGESTSESTNCQGFRNVCRKN